MLVVIWTGAVLRLGFLTTGFILTGMMSGLALAEVDTGLDLAEVDTRLALAEVGTGFVLTEVHVGLALADVDTGLALAGKDTDLALAGLVLALRGLDSGFRQVFSWLGMKLTLGLLDLTRLGFGPKFVLP